MPTTGGVGLCSTLDRMRQGATAVNARAAGRAGGVVLRRPAPSRKADRDAGGWSVSFLPVAQVTSGSFGP